MGQVIPSSDRFDDRGARERIRTSLEESLLVEAAAGTGKTTELIRRIVAVLRTGAGRVENLVAVTFTQKAAGELKLRLRADLDQALIEARQGTAGGSAAAEAEVERLESAIAHLEEARVGTIHSFCADLLRERPVEAGVDPDFRELAEGEQERLFRRAFRNWLEAKLSEASTVVRRALERLAQGEPETSGQSPTEALYVATREFAEYRDYDRPWEQRPFSREEEIERLLDEAVVLAELSTRCTDRNDNLFVALEPVREFAEYIHRERATGARFDSDRWEARLLRLARQLKKGGKGAGKEFAPGLPRRQVVDQRGAFLQRLGQFNTAASADLAARLQGEMGDLLGTYDRLKRASGGLDFMDLLLKARALVRDHTAVRQHLQRRFTHIFVDEFQDTDPLQAEILLLLAAEDSAESDWLEATPARGKLFVVGDPKQSVYRFRRADVMLYQEVRERLAGRGVPVLYLTRSFRAPAPLQQALNFAFAEEIREDRLSGQPRYVPLEPSEDRTPVSGQPHLVALPVPEPYSEYGNITKKAIEASLPKAVAAFVDWLLNKSGWQVHDPEDPEYRRLVPVEARHVALLFRRFVSWGDDVTREYRHALEAREVQHFTVGATALHTREEIETLRVALAAIEWPDDELSVFATLKGPPFAVPDSLLLRYRELAGGWRPLRPPPEKLPADLEPVAVALETLGRLHRRRNWRPLVATVAELLEVTRSPAGLALRPAGHQALANVNRLCEEARSFESSGGISFRAFVEDLEAQAEREARSESLVFEEGAEGVRLITVHKAKGLEFPVVILADLTARLAREATRYTDGRQRLCAQKLAGCEPWDLLDHRQEETARDQAEGVRVAYVAATRARDLLVVTAVGESKYQGGWLEPLNRSLYPDLGRWRQSQPAPGCPAFGKATALAGYEDDALLERLVRPGLHAVPGAEHDAVWWDPQQLELDVQGSFGLRQEVLLRPSEQSAEGEKQYADWKAERKRTLEGGSQPEFEVTTATQAPALPAGFECPIALQMVDRRSERPQGRRFGTLVHTALRDVSLRGTMQDIERLVRFHGRVLGATSAELSAAANAVSSALAHPVLKRVRAAPEHRREFPLSVLLDSGQLVEGVLDLAFLEDGVWTVVDFKTDAEVPTRRPHYERQLKWYALGLASLSGLPVRGILLAV